MTGRYLGVVLIVAAIVLTSCSDSTDGGGASVSVTGTITVSDESYWNDVKLAVFSGGDLGDYDMIDRDNNFFTGDGETYRLIYDDVRDGSTVAIDPTGTAVTFTGTSGTSTPYTYVLPATIPDSTDTAAEYYFFVAWLDTDEDGKLDMIDSADESAIAASTDAEMNRFSTKETTNTDGQPTTILVTHFQQSLDLETSQPSGRYKYVGFDNQAYNEQSELEATTSSGFNFEITADTGF